MGPPTRRGAWLAWRGREPGLAPPPQAAEPHPGVQPLGAPASSGVALTWRGSERRPAWMPTPPSHLVHTGAWLAGMGGQPGPAPPPMTLSWP